MTKTPQPNQNTITPEERFWAKITITEPDECWEWQASLIGKGYGSHVRNGTTQLAHRVAWELHHGQPIPPGLMICHTCDRKKCCNPAHLYAGTAAQNSRDAVQRERRYCKITNAQVMKARVLAQDLGMSPAQLADMYQIGVGYMAKIINGQERTAVPMP